MPIGPWPAAIRIASPPEFIEAARPGRHAPGDRWFADDTYLKIVGKWAYLYRAIDQHGQVIDVLLSERRDLAAALPTTAQFSQQSSLRSVQVHLRRPVRSGTVGVTSVVYVEDVDDVGVLVNRIADAVLAAAGSPLSLEGLAQGGADSARLFAEGAADELETGPGDGFG